MKQRPAAAGTAVRHANAARVDDQAPIDEANERRVGVAAHHRLVMRGQAGEGFLPPVKGRVDEHDLVVATRTAMAKDDGAEPVNVEDERVWQIREQTDLILGQLPSGPWRDVVWDLDVLTTVERDELPIGVAAYQPHPIRLGDQALENLARLWTGCMIASDHDQIRGADVGLREHRLENGKHSVNVREHRN